MQPSFEAIGTLGWNVIKVEDGHDLQAVYSALESGAPRRVSGEACVSLGENHQGQGHCVWRKMPPADGLPLGNAEKIVGWVQEI